MPHVEQELLTIPKNPSSPLLFSVACVVRSSVLCVKFCISLFVLFYNVVRVHLAIYRRKSPTNLIVLNRVHLTIYRRKSLTNLIML